MSPMHMQLTCKDVGEVYCVLQGLGLAIKKWIDDGIYAPVTADTCTSKERRAAARRFADKSASKSGENGEPSQQ